VNAALPAVLAGASVASFLLAATTRLHPAVRRFRDVLAPASKNADVVRTGLGSQRAHPFIRRVARLDRLEELLAASGRSWSLHDLLKVKMLAGVSVGVLLAAAAPRLIPLAFLAGFGAFAAPDLLVARAARARRRSADAEVPQFLDLVAAASTAGLAAPAAIDRATAGLRGPLADELLAASSAVEAGARWREELSEVASRLRLPDLAAAVRVVGRSERLGSSLAANLRELAAEVRESRRARAAERARTAPVKMLFPLVFMVLPAFLLLTVVPVLIATIRSLD
jgi:pilus assembly protein TadC